MAANSATVWRWPVRLVHWLLVMLVTAQFITGDVLEGAMDWHVRIGYALLALVLFRVVWGFVGDRHARFADFVHGPSRVLAYAKRMLSGTAEPTVGHNPMGGWAVVALLLLLAAQTISGLFMTDDVFTEGPLYAHTSQNVNDSMLWWHHSGSNLLLALVALHVGAIAYHRLRLKERLVGPMLHGIKRNLPSSYTADPRARHLTAVVALALSIAAVTALVLIARATAPETSFY